nr:MAG TPA: hypothetical protein [Caudoviricetes sp.]
MGASPLPPILPPGSRTRVRVFSKYHDKPRSPKP